MMTEEQRKIIIDTCNVMIARDDSYEYSHNLRMVAETTLAALTQPASPALKLPDAFSPHDAKMFCAAHGVTGAYELASQMANYAVDKVVRLNDSHTAPIEPICATGGAEWVKVSEGMPKRGQRVNAFYLNRLGKGRTIRAEYIYSKTEEAGECDPDTQCVEYCEESDTYFVTEGWYEVMDNWEEYGSIAVTEGNITHWMPLPAAPTS